MSGKMIRIATRKSPLAMWQAHYVKDKLLAAHDGLTVELVPMVTKGDIILDSPLAKIGGKGLFIKELEVAMQQQRADIAVHSMKDVPMEFPEGFGLHAICQREDPRDAFVSNSVSQIEQLPHGATVGTSSLRRQCQLRAFRPDLKVKDLRGNVNTRLQKLDDGQYDGIILAAAGLLRLNMPSRIASYINTEQILPAAGQGAVGIECCNDRTEVIAMLKPLIDPSTDYRVTAERAMNRRLNGGCQVPIGGFAQLQDDRLYLRGLVGSTDGKTILRADANYPKHAAEQCGIDVAEQLLNQGADALLSQLNDD